MVAMAQGRAPTERGDYKHAISSDSGLAELAPPSMMWADIECRSHEVALRFVTRTRHLWWSRLFQLQCSLQTGDRGAKGTTRRGSFHPTARSKRSEERR